VDFQEIQFRAARFERLLRHAPSGTVFGALSPYTDGGAAVVIVKRGARNVNLLKSRLVAIPSMSSHTQQRPAASVDRVISEFRSGPARGSGLATLFVDDNLQPVIWNLRLPQMDLSYALLPNRNAERRRVVPVHRERQNRTVGDESAPCFRALIQLLIRELSINVRKHAVRTHRDKGVILSVPAVAASQNAVQVAYQRCKPWLASSSGYNFS